MQLPLGEDSIHYQIEGKGPETLVFIPALGLTGDMWKQQVEHFRTSHTVVTYDAGHMQSGPVRQDATLEEFAEELARLLDAVGVISGHIVGISMGGMIAQVFAINHPDRVKSVVLACTTPSYPEESRRQMRTRADTAEHEGMQPLVDGIIERWFTAEFGRDHPDAVGRVREMLLRANPRAYAAAARAVADVDTMGQLSSVQAPALLLQAQHDGSMPVDAVDRLTSEIPRARSAVIPASAHLCNVGNPDAFNAEVSALLREVMNGLPDDPGLRLPASAW